MLELILLSVILALCINGIFIVFNWEGMLLEPLGLMLEGYLPEWVCKVYFACATCMSGLYGLATYYFYYGCLGSLVELIAFISMTACLSTLINIFLECAKSITELSNDELGRTAKF